MGNKTYNMKEICKVRYNDFNIYGVKIGQVYIEYIDEHFKKKKLKIFSEDLKDKKFKHTGLYQAMYTSISEMTKLSE